MGDHQSWRVALYPAARYRNDRPTSYAIAKASVLPVSETTAFAAAA